MRRKLRRLKKNVFYGICAGIVAVLTCVRHCCPQVVSTQQPLTTTDSVAPSPVVEKEVAPAPKQKTSVERASLPDSLSELERHPHPVRSVPSYRLAFPDLQDVQIVSARKWGVEPVRDRRQAEQRKSELVYVGDCPFYDIDPTMKRSVPYLVPRASLLLHTLGRNFMDSLYVKGIPPHKFIVSSVLRTEEDVRKLMQFNQNASEQSCHRFGTTIDISYNRYTTVAPPGERRREVRNDTLKWVLSEVLRDARERGECYIKYEVHQGCFHITVR